MAAIANWIKALTGMLVLFGLSVYGVLSVVGVIGDGRGPFRDVEGADDDQPDTVTRTGLGERTDLFVDDDDLRTEDEIEAAVRAGLLTACTLEEPSRFCPSTPITRADFAIAMDAAITPPDAEMTFADVPSDAPYAGAVARIAAIGVTSGCDDDRFCPDDPVTRAQAAAFLTRALDLPAADVPSFEDVPPDSSFAPAIGSITAAGVLGACVQVPFRFCPDDPLTRADTASLFVAAGLAE